MFKLNRYYTHIYGGITKYKAIKITPNSFGTTVECISPHGGNVSKIQ